MGLPIVGAIEQRSGEGPGGRLHSGGQYDAGGPFSLDGVSVVLTQSGAPRLAHVGYISPTQINFLMPSDLAANPVTLQVKNPAGITTAVPLTVQANAAQLFTSDGKSALGIHANGTLLGKSAPARPGETIVIYATGLGPTNPALIPGQVPTNVASLATLPQVTIGGAAATVGAAAVVPGTAGLYQMSVQLPSDAPNGDLPVIVRVGTTSSVGALITVQQ